LWCNSPLFFVSPNDYFVLAAFGAAAHFLPAGHYPFLPLAPHLQPLQAPFLQVAFLQALQHGFALSALAALGH
jgi:hypothetical protein